MCGRWREGKRRISVRGEEEEEEEQVIGRVKRENGRGRRKRTMKRMCKNWDT